MIKIVLKGTKISFSGCLLECKNLSNIRGSSILLCQIISVECPTNFDQRFKLIDCLGLPLIWLDVSSRKFKFCGHSTDIIRQSEIKGPLLAIKIELTPPVYIENLGYIEKLMNAVYDQLRQAPDVYVYCLAQKDA